MKKILAALTAALVAVNLLAADKKPVKVVGAYLFHAERSLPDPALVNHIYFAFGHVNDTFNGVRIPEPDLLHQTAALKKQSKDLKVLLSIGGWGSGNFSEMAADPALRKAFAKDCARVCKEFKIDGIDIDWEYPGSNAAGISSSPDDEANFTLLMRDLRTALGKKRLLTFASVGSAHFIDYKAVCQYVDYVNVMSYDMDGAGHKHHQAALYRSQFAGDATTEECALAHLAAGVPKSKLVVGMPFYGRGTDRKGGTEYWDEVGCVPIRLDTNWNFVFGFEDERSIAAKCEYVLDNELAGAMYWEWNSEKGEHVLAKTAHDCLLLPHETRVWHRPANYAKDKVRFKALLYWDPSAEPAHVEFDKQSMEFFHKLTYGEGFVLDTTTTLSAYTYDQLKEYSVIVALNAVPGDKVSRDLFEKYMENGGGWVGFHGAGYNDCSTGWPWLRDFLGCGVFKCNNWPPQAALMDIDTHDHDITRNLPDSYVAPASEFYQWSRDFRSDPDIQVLVTLSPKNYPIGLKDIVYGGDFPVVWTNKKYRMVYLNMGHGDECYKDATQNLLFTNAFRWVVSQDPSGNPFDK